MTVEECYARMGADYRGTLGRLGKVSLIRKLLEMACRDPSFSSLEEALAAEDIPSAFRSAHTLKGIGLNLGLTSLTAAASDLTEALRAGERETGALFERTARAYRAFCSAVEELLAGETVTG